MDFTKLQGTANDFVLIEADGMDRDWPKQAVAICDRHLGVGADSLLLLLPSAKADFRMRTFDADGSEAETCGNGIRCLSRYVLERGRVGPYTSEITVETLAGMLTAEVTVAEGHVESVRVAMGRPRFAPQEIPVAIEAEPPLPDVALEMARKEIVRGITPPYPIP